MKTRLFKRFALALLLSTQACDDSFPAISEVDSLRLLAVRADHPFAKPGQTVSFEALAYDPAQRPLTWAWGPCDASRSSTALECLRTLRFEDLEIAADMPVHSATVPEDALRDGQASSLLGVVVVVCPGSIEKGDTLGFPLACVDASGRELNLDEFELGMKRVFVRTNTENNNPEIEGLRWDGELWSEGEQRTESCGGSKCQRHELEVITRDAAEDSVDAQGKSVREQAVVQLYSTLGELEDALRIASDAKTRWTPRKKDSGKSGLLWVVVRDDRGGVSWTERDIAVR